MSRAFVAAIVLGTACVRPRAPAPPPAPSCAAPLPRPALTADQALGMNGFVDDPVAVLAAAAIVREYHPWDWEQGTAQPAYPGDRSRFARSDAGWDLDAFYAALAAAGTVASPALQGGPRWMGVREGVQPVWPRGASTDPGSYRAHADHLFQLVARYGHRRVPDEALKLAAEQPRRSGLGVLAYVENWNEPDRWWVGPPGAPGHFTAGEFAAMTSADFDGHCGALGPGAGVRAADPGVRLVLGGLAGSKDGDLGLAYLDELRRWTDDHRGGSFPADVINVHHYCRRGDTGVSPEADGLRARLAALVAWRDRHLPGRELWLSEFGWDVNPGSPQRAPALGTLDAPAVQAAWIARAYLAALAAGVDRAFVYMSRDVDAASPAQYGSSGLTSRAHEPRPSWRFLATLRRHLRGLRADGEPATGDARVSALRFHGAGGARAYALWCPTSADQRRPGFSLAVAPAIDAALVSLGDGAVRPLAVADGHVTVDVGEVPQLVLTRDTRAPPDRTAATADR